MLDWLAVRGWASPAWVKLGPLRHGAPEDYLRIDGREVELGRMPDALVRRDLVGRVCGRSSAMRTWWLPTASSESSGEAALEIGLLDVLHPPPERDQQ